MLNNIKKNIKKINSKLKFLLLLPVFNQYSMNRQDEVYITNLKYESAINIILLGVTFEIQEKKLYITPQIRTDTITKVTTLIVEIVNNYKKQSLEIITVFFINLYNIRHEKFMHFNRKWHKYGKKNIFEMLCLKDYEFFTNNKKEKNEENEKKEKKKILIDLIILVMEIYFNLNDENINVIGNTIFKNQFNNKEEFDKKYADFIKDIYNNPREEAMKKTMYTCYMIYSEFSDLKKDTILQINEKEIEIKIEKEKEKYDEFLNQLRDSYYSKQELEKNKF